MSSDALQSALTELLLNDYTSAVLITAVGYDYIVTLPEEIDYIWCMPWTWVSTFFVPVRYFGLIVVMTSALLGSSFLPDPAKTYVFVPPVLCMPPHTTDIYQTAVSMHTRSFPVDFIYRCLQGQIMAIISGWAFLVFLGAADLVMILRIWVMYDRSRLILGSLLVLLSAEVISTILAVAVYNIPKHLPTEVIQILDYEFCAITLTLPAWTNTAIILQITQGGVMCMLAVVQFVRQSLEMYRATKQWQLNQYMDLLVKQGILSFLAVFLFNLVNVLFAFGKAPTGGWQLLLSILIEYLPLYTLTPRFILSIRKLYALDARRGLGIDTGFGLSSTGRRAGRAVTAFADIGQNHVSEDTEEIPMEGCTTGTV